MTTLYQDIVLRKKPVLFLPLNEASGTLYDITGNGYDALALGSFSRNSTAKTIDGVGGIAVTTGGANCVAVQKSVSEIGDLAREPWSAEFWWAFTGNAPSNAFELPFFGWTISLRSTTPSSLTGNDVSFYISEYSAATPTSYHRMNYGSPNGQAVETTGSGTLTADRRIDTAFSYSSYFMGGPTGYTTLPGSTALARSTVLNHTVMVVDPVLALDLKPVVHLNTSSFTSSTAGDLSGRFGQQPNDNVGPGLFAVPRTQSAFYASGISNLWMSHFAVYDKALTTAEIAEHYRHGMGITAGWNRVAGSVLLDGTPTQGFPVFVHRRDTGELVGQGVSDINGAFTVYTQYSGTVYAVAFDTVSGIHYNAQVYDLITPAP